MILAAAFALAAVPGVILFTATVCAAVILVVMTLRDRRWPIPIVAACWLPALLVMSARFAPRPPRSSRCSRWRLYLMVLLRTDLRPELAWTLPLVQVIWVNTHGLFVLGPIILGAHLAERLLKFSHSSGDPGPDRSQSWRWWRHLSGAAVLVAIACLVNPYGLRGALFPLEIFPKITAWGGLYKSYIAEFGDLRELVRRQGPAAAASPVFLTECFLLWAIPPSFIIPAAWRAARPGARRALIHVVALVLVLILILTGVLGLRAAASGSAPWLTAFGWLAPAALIALGIAAAGMQLKSSRPAALLASIGATASSAWILWLQVHLLGHEPFAAPWLRLIEPGATILGWVTALLLVATAGLALRSGGRLFVMIVAVAFSYLALQAIRNMNLFALAAGFVLTWNLAGWATDLAAARVPRPSQRTAGLVFGLTARFTLAALLVLFFFAITSGRFFLTTGEPLRRGLREAPLAYAHQAAQFAGQSGLSDRALAFDLGLADVYLFHNGPKRKLFMDGRLEVPDLATFATYVRLENMLNEGRPGWAEPVRRMGNPLILLGHDKEFGAEATLLVDPGWRCIYYDAVASIFVARDGHVDEQRFPIHDFAERHFYDPSWRKIPSRPRGIAEARALLNLGWALRVRDGLTGRLPDSIMLAAGNRLRQAIADEPDAAGLWTMLAAIILEHDRRLVRPAAGSSRALGSCPRDFPGTGHVLLPPRSRAGPQRRRRSRVVASFP